MASAKKWLLGQAMSPAGAKIAAVTRLQADVASPRPAGSAEAAATAGPLPSHSKLLQHTPRTSVSLISDPSPASQFPRSFPVAVDGNTTVLVRS